MQGAYPQIVLELHVGFNLPNGVRHKCYQNEVGLYMVDLALRHTHNAFVLQVLENHLVYLVVNDKYHIPQGHTADQIQGYL